MFGMAASMGLEKEEVGGEGKMEWGRGRDWSQLRKSLGCLPKGVDFSKGHGSHSRLGAGACLGQIYLLEFALPEEQEGLLQEMKEARMGDLRPARGAESG